MLLFPTLFSSLLFFIILCGASIEPLNYERVRYIDTVNGNFLFRGNQPELNNTFAYTTLLQYLANRSQEANVTLPASFYLVDISLLDPNNTGELPALQTEINFFQQNPDLGMLIQWPLYGNLEGPENYTESEVVKMAACLPDWQADQLPEKSVTIRNMLQNGIMEINKPIVIYVHCGHGQDRTGEMSGSYELQYLNIPFLQIWTFDINFGMDVVANMNALRWFCQYWAVTTQQNNIEFCAISNSTQIVHSEL